jgi:hypothetical protein
MDQGIPENRRFAGLAPYCDQQEKSVVTSLIVGAVVPMWDRALVRAIKEAMSDVDDEPATWHFGVVNDEGKVYRRIVVHGAMQLGKLLECLLSDGFYPAHSVADGTVIRRRAQSTSIM